MGSAGGGVAAASGFYYQYLVTLDRLLDLLEGDVDDVAVHVEPPPAHASDDIDIVDFSVVRGASQLLEVVQVKSSGVGRALTGPETRAAILRLVDYGDADRYRLVTNAPLNGPAKALEAALEAGATDLPGVDVGGLSSTERARLSRCKIETDPRSALELRNALRERLRRYRTAARHGVGYEAAGLLTGYLVSEIFERGGLRSERVMPLSELRDLVLVGAPVLASATGAKWGVSLGAVAWLPDVERPDALAAVVDILRPDRVPDRVSACSITGLSGLGKTSLAAAYSHDYADAYDFIAWIESESMDTIRASVADILYQLEKPQLEAPADEKSVQGAFHRLLGSHPGTWLVIFDGAVDPKTTNAWLPVRGSGHVIITSTNSTGWTQLPQLDLDPMTQPEALALVRLRLKRQMNDAADATPALIDLVSELERWPLALELACAYISSTGLAVNDIPAYMQTLRTRALADETLVLPSYPRTLVAAVYLCLERIVAQTSLGDPADPHSIALRLLEVVAYLAARRIPVHLALSCVLFSKEAKRRVGPGAGVIERAHFEPREVVRVLMGQSLVTTDRATDPAPPLDAPAGILATAWTISTNEVIQELIREMGSGKGVPGLLERMAFHVQDWLVGYLADRDFRRVAIVEPHVSVVAGHAQRLGLGSVSVALLLGNLAVAYRARGLLGDAIDLLQNELAMLDGIGMGPSILHVKIHQELARLRADAYMPEEEVLPAIAAALECVRTGALEPGSVANQLEDMRGVVEHLEHRRADLDLAPLRAELDGLLAIAGSAVNATIFAVGDLITAGHDAEALARVEARLADRDLPVEQRLVFDGLRLECLAHLRQWNDAHDALEALAPVDVDLVYLVNPFLDIVLNGAVAAFSAVQSRDERAIRFFLESVRIADRVVDSGAALSSGNLARHAALRSFGAVLRGDTYTARQAIAALKPADLELVDASSTVIYELMRAIAQRWLDKQD